MDGHKLQVLMHRVVDDELFRFRMEKANSLDHVLQILASEGLDMGAEEFRAAMRLLVVLAKSPSKDLDDNDLDTVAGGMRQINLGNMLDIFAGDKGSAAVNFVIGWHDRLNPCK